MPGGDKHNLTKANHMRQLLRESDWTIGGLASEVGANPGQVHRLIHSEMNVGNVVIAGKRSTKDRGGWMKDKNINLYTWSGDDDLITMAIRAAEYLREHAKDQLGLSLANHLMRLSGASEVPKN